MDQLPWMRTGSAQTSPERPQICPTAHATGMGDSSVPPIARKAIYAPVDQSQAAMTQPRSEKECPLATPSACRARIAFVLTDPRGVLRSRHSALWAVAGSGVESQAIRHPRPLLFAPAGPEANAFSKTHSVGKPKGGAAAGGSGGQRPPRGSIRRRSGATEDRGTSMVPAGEVRGRHGEAVANAHSLSSWRVSKEAPEIIEREIF